MSTESWQPSFRSLVELGDSGGMVVPLWRTLRNVAMRCRICAFAVGFVVVVVAAAVGAVAQPSSCLTNQSDGLSGRRLAHY